MTRAENNRLARLRIEDSGVTVLQIGHHKFQKVTPICTATAAARLESDLKGIIPENLVIVTKSSRFETRTPDTPKGE